MKNSKKILLKLSSVILVLFFAVFIGCKNSPTDSVVNTDPTTDKAALEKITLEDSALSSFELNYNEEGMMDLMDPLGLGKTTSEIFPVKVGRKITSVTRTFTINQITDTTAEGNLVIVFTGNLLIGITRDPSTKVIDTVITKPFVTTVERNVKFVKVANTVNPQMNWRIASSSVTKGGTNSPNIYIKSIKAYLPSGDSITITDPLNYYFSHGLGRMKEMPSFAMNQEVTLVVEIHSAYAAEDFVTLTFGGGQGPMHQRVKGKFTLVSDDEQGNKVYSLKFHTRPVRGHSHTVIDALPAQVIKDDVAPVESSAWGFPYLVK
ncbi:MAG: hypothetical protein M0Q21_02225 [Ignavibacteriaceae bacterium]|nr:hypothetical protein [Ignavibacteriaceae bacterium]